MEVEKAIKLHYFTNKLAQSHVRIPLVYVLLEIQLTYFDFVYIA